jgi:predicted DNA-binding transcriptional regulator YafY
MKKGIMSKLNFQKIKLLKIMEILKFESDEDCPLSTVDLLSRLKEEGIICDRRTLYNDIDVLNSCGYEIYKTRSKTNKYYIVNRDFDIAELRILIDAVQAAAFITEKKTKQLIDKIANLAGNYRAILLKHDINCFDTVKHTNEKIFYYVDTIDRCILNKKQVSFLYFYYNISGEKEYRKNKQRYIVNPITLIYSHENYYLVCYNDKYKNLSNYRIDRMEDVKEEMTDITKAKCAESFNVNKYRKQIFSMFTGEMEEVEILVHKDLVDVIIDKFGENVKMMAQGKEHFIIKVKVHLSPVFYTWCCGFGGKLKLISPEHVIKKLKEHLEEVINNYY